MVWRHPLTIPWGHLSLLCPLNCSSILWLAEGQSRFCNLVQKAGSYCLNSLFPQKKILVHVQQFRARCWDEGIIWDILGSGHSDLWSCLPASIFLLSPLINSCPSCRKQRENKETFPQESVKMQLQRCDHIELFIPGQVCGLSSPEDHKLSFLTALLRPGKC